jgi:hypothetical protein
MVKAFGDRADTRRSLGAALERFTADPLLAALLIVALVALLATLTTAVDRGDVHRLRFPAAVTVVAGSFHVVLGAVDPSLRYESYLVALGVWVLLRLAAVVDAGSLGGLRGLRRFRRVPAALVILAVVPFATMQARATATVPHDARVMADQRYQVARFLDRAYEADSIAISELGYIGLYHDGPLTDVYGLGDHQVARARIDERADARFWRGLQRRRGFRVVAAYPFSLACEEPEGWIAVASWHTPDAFYPEIVFWAAVPAEVAPLRRHLEAFEAELPDTVEVSYNELAELAAAQALQAPEG